MIVKITLDELLKDKNIPQRELARMTGIRHTSINEMCLNKTERLPLKNLAKICDVLDCDITDILVLEKEQTE